MEIPDSLAEKLELWRRAGRVAQYSRGVFLEASWIAVYTGQGVIPHGWDQRADAFDIDALDGAVERLKRQLRDAARAMPMHGEFIARRNALIEAPAA